MRDQFTAVDRGDHQRVFALESLEERLTERLPAFEQGLGIAAGAECDTGAIGDRVAQCEVVVDLAVEHDQVSPVGTVHRLLSRRDVLEREPEVAQPQMLQKQFAVLGVAAMRHALRRPAKRLNAAFDGRCGGAVGDDAGKSTHIGQLSGVA